MLLFLKRVVSKTRTAEEFQNPKRNINGVPTRYLYSWGGRLSISFRFNKNIKAPQVGAFFVLFSPFRELLLPSAVILLTQWYCVAVIFAFKASCGFTLTSAGSRNIILATAKISLWRSQNITCEANITAHLNPRAANPEFPFHGFWKAWFPKTEQRRIFIIYRKIAFWKKERRLLQSNIFFSAQRT